MEDEDDYIQFYDLDIDENQVVKIQAFVRGKQVRKWFREIRADYEMAVKEIEKNKSVIVQWPSTEIGIPKVQKQKQATKKSSMQGVMPNNSARNSPNIDCPKSVRDDISSSTRVEKIKTEHTKPRQSSKSVLLEAECNRVTQKPFESSNDLNPGNISSFSQRNVGCTVETQTSINEETLSVSSSRKVREIDREEVQEKTSVKTYDMLIQTDDTSDQRETTRPAENIRTQNSDIMDQHETKQCVNREMLEQKINKFETQLQTLKDISHQGTNKIHDQDVSPVHISKSSTKDSPENERTNQVIFSESPRGRRPSYHQESSVLTNVTSVWDSFNSECKENVPVRSAQITYPTDPETLKEMRKNVSMELLWVQQAIDSRKNYLKLKNQMRVAT